ncbi:MAG: RHS repeat protein, partial [Mycobacterium sp.]|nr:RHS repeat protein [Mycobacterium sp.]
ITKANYDADGLLKFTQDADHTAPNGQPLCTACTDPSQYRTIYHYDSFNRLAAVSQPKSTSLELGKLIWTDTVYDANDNVVAQVDPYYGSGDGKAGDINRKAGDTTTTTYDVMDRPILTTGPDTSADPQGERTQYHYDDAGRLDQEVTPVGYQSGVRAPASTSPGTINFTYDTLDRQLTQTSYHKDASGVVHPLTTYNCYDNVGNLTSVTQPDANLSSLSCPAVQGTTPFTSFYTYDAAHRQLTSTDGDGHATSYKYDDDGNQTQVTNPKGITSINTYDQLNRLVRTDQPFISNSSPNTCPPAPGDRCVTTEVQYDKAGNKVADISPRAYDASPDKQTFNNYVTRYHYDKDNRLVQTDLPVDGTYSAPHYVLQTYDPNGFETAISKPVTNTDPAQLTSNQETTMRYFDTGWIYTSQDPGIPAVHFDYTAKGEQMFRAPENGEGVVDTKNQMSWDYYPDGQVKDRFDNQHQPIAYSYNADDVLTSAYNGAGLTDMMQRGPINT